MPNKITDRTFELKEIWKPIVTKKTDFTGIYEVSNLGRIKSLKRATNNQYGSKEILLKSCLDKDGYPTVCLRKNGNKKTYRVHLLVWDAFGSGKRDGMKIQVDHKDHDRTNSKFTNLQLLDFRSNTVKARQRKKSNLPPGVYLDKKSGKYKSNITIKGKRFHLGYFIDPIEAGKAYDNKLNEVAIG